METYPNHTANCGQFVVMLAGISDLIILIEGGQGVCGNRTGCPCLCIFKLHDYHLICRVTKFEVNEFRGKEVGVAVSIRKLQRCLFY